MLEALDTSLISRNQAGLISFDKTIY